MCKINPRVDFAFKLIFGNEQNKDILISLLNSILEDYQTSPIEWIEILNPIGKKNYDKEKLVILDIRARDEKGEYYNIEMQITDQHYYQKRALYYWSKLYCSQIEEGETYFDLRRTVSINILNFDAIVTGKNFHSVYRLKNMEDNIELTNQIEVHFIELKKFSKDLPDLKRTLDRWIYFLKHAEKFSEKSLPDPLKEVKSIEKASKVLNKISLNRDQREIYEARLKMLRDEGGALETARIKGLEEGRKEGIEEGIKKGETKGERKKAIATAKESLRIGLSNEVIPKITGLSVEEIKNLKNE